MGILEQMLAKLDLLKNHVHGLRVLEITEFQSKLCDPQQSQRVKID